MVALLRTLQLDPSDRILFDPAATPGEWAVPGGFLFADRPPHSLSRKERVAWRSGFLGVESFGHSTLAVVTPISEAELQGAVLALAQNLVARLGAPDLATALPAAQEEIAFAQDLCRGHPEGRLIALQREEGPSGEVTERFRALRPRQDTAWNSPGMAGHDRAFHFVETDAAEEDDPFDLLHDFRAHDSRAKDQS